MPEFRLDAEDRPAGRRGDDDNDRDAAEEEEEDEEEEDEGEELAGRRERIKSSALYGDSSLDMTK